MEELLVCPKCKSSYETTDLFCRVCGRKLKEKTLATSFSKQLSTYLISLLLPPLGLWPAIKYLRQGDIKSKQIGIIAIVITVISVIISIIVFTKFMHSFNNTLNGPSEYDNLTF